MDEKVDVQVDFADLEATLSRDQRLISTLIVDGHPLFPTHATKLSMIQKLLGYPPSGSLKIRSTSWLDGVRGVAALAVYIFHVMGCWAPLVPAWHADEHQTNILQFPILRTFFVSGGTAVSLFFAISGYVLTYKSLRWIREGLRHQVYPSVASSMFRRGFRLYLPPILVTFCEMLATRFGVAPPLNFTFTPELSLWAQFLDWLRETNHMINPVYNTKSAIQGFVSHPKYDAVVWTMPLEFYGSLVCYTLLLALVRIPGDALRMGLLAVFAISSMGLGSWNLFCFSAGMLIADFNLRQEPEIIAPPRPPKHRKIWTVIFAIAFYVSGFPTLGAQEAKLKPMPGFETIRWLIPMRLNMEDHARFWWSISGVALLLSISQLPRLKKIFESNFCQYLGKISFSLYLVHQFFVVLFGLSLQRLLMRLASLEPKQNTLLYWLIFGIWFTLFTAPVFAVATQFERWVDVPSVVFARWLEGKCLKFYRRLH